MAEINDILDYFIKYEIDNRLNNIELSRKEFEDINREDFQDVTIIKDKIYKKKIEYICNIIKNIKWKNENKIDEVLNYIDNGLNIEEDFCFQELVKKEDYKFQDNYAKDVNKINSVIRDNRLLILYPILSSGKRKIPLICFEVNLKDEQLIVESYNLQIDTLRIILSFVLDCEVADVELFVDDFHHFFESLSTISNADVFKIVKSIENELANKFNNYGFTSLWDNKNYNNWAMTSEIILTLESLGECLFLPYQKEIEEVKYHLKQNDSTLVRKYLSFNEMGKSSDEIILKGHLGSYTGKFPINDKQTKVLAAYQNNDLLAVNGPPGTGKTTVIKELIADNIVKKTKNLIEIWDHKWQNFGTGNQLVNQSPLKGTCQYSMLIASGNNNAVDNIGKELQREISYFSDVVMDSDEINGLLCARLGNFNNMCDFRDQMLNPLIKSLEKSDYHEEFSLKQINYFKKEYVELENINNKISTYLSLRDKIFLDFKETGLFDDDINSQNVVEIIANLKENMQSLDKKMSFKSAEQNRLKEEKLHISNEIFQYSEMISEYEDKISKRNLMLDEMNEVSKSKFFPRIRLKRLKRKYGSNLSDVLERLNNEMLILKGLYDERNLLLNNTKEKIESINNELSQDKLTRKDYSSKIEKLKEFESLIFEYTKLTNEIGVNVDWDSDKHLFFNHESIVKKRFKLFEISLKVTECFIKKHSKEIVFNLKKVFVDKWFQPFYRGNFRYDEIYTVYLKSIWETLTLCFPVVTTTLYSFDYRKFPMIHEMFDTLLIDEAGQSAIHTAIGPLYRFRKAVIVGDVFQLEPIHKYKNNLIETTKFTNEIKALVDVNENSIQNAADRSSDVFDLINDQKVGMILNEHRRCENSIVQFSNKYVYGNSLILTKEDQEKPFLKNNLIMIDVRGTKEKNVNTSEIDICSRIVDKLLEINGEDYKKNIGIITPYKNQVNRLASNFKDISCGTVHAFQGKEKETIILSLVIDDPRNIGNLNFVGGKPNFLNVAFTRAKSQLIIVGNYEVCSTARNYLSKAIQTVKDYGTIYSVYEPDYFENKKIDVEYKNQFLSLLVNESNSDYRLFKILNQYSINGLIAGPKNHNSLLNDAFSYANKSIHIITPWIRSYVVTSAFLENVSKFKAKDKSITICFGYNKTGFNLHDLQEIVKKDNSVENIEKDVFAIEKLYQKLGNKLKYIPPIHSKVLIIDDLFMIVGSHNWLSNSGKQANIKDEVSCIITDLNAINYIKKRYQIDGIG